MYVLLNTLHTYLIYPPTLYLNNDYYYVYIDDNDYILIKIKSRVDCDWKEYIFVGLFIHLYDLNGNIYSTHLSMHDKKRNK